MTRIADLIARRAPSLVSVTLDELNAWQAECIAADPGPFVGPPAKRRPVSWMDALRFRCIRGHVTDGALNGGAICCGDNDCNGAAVLTFPEDNDERRTS